MSESKQNYLEYCAERGFLKRLSTMCGGLKSPVTVLLILYLIILLTTISIDVKNATQGVKMTALEAFGKYFGLIFSIVFQLFLMDCIIYGGCTTFAWFVLAIYIILLILVALVLPVIVLTQSKPAEASPEQQ